jgi:hypothetical protein
MTRNIYVPLPDPVREALYELAEREWRHPKEQASKLLVEGLRRAGMLADQPPAGGDESGPEAGDRPEVAP